MQRDDTGCGAPEDARVARETVRLACETLPAAFFYNVPFAMALAFVLWLGGARAGGVSLADVGVVGLMQCVGAAVASLLYRRRATELADPPRLERRLIEVQVLIGIGWGASAWWCWRDGSLLNNVIVGMTFFSLTWSTATLRAVRRRVFLAGMLTLGGSYALLFALSGGEAADVMLAVTPFWLLYIVAMGRSLRERVTKLLRLRFENEDLAGALRLMRDEALSKKLEVERANAAKSVFLANMSHELRTPLNAILGFSEIIAQRLFDDAPERYAEYAQDINTSGAHLLSLINDLLDISKIEAGRMEIDPQPLDAGEMLADAERLVRSRAETRGQTLIGVVKKDAPPLYADARAFKQIALNLLSNAIKFAPPGGHIEISCGRAPEGGFILRVRDDGPGIAPDMLGKVFKPFDQVDNRYNRKNGGTGLGLALVRGLAELHGGRAWLESEIGHGTDAFVYLPLRDMTPSVRQRA